MNKRMYVDMIKMFMDMLFILEESFIVVHIKFMQLDIIGFWFNSDIKNYSLKVDLENYVLNNIVYLSEYDPMGAVEFGDILHCCLEACTIIEQMKGEDDNMWLIMEAMERELKSLKVPYSLKRVSDNEYILNVSRIQESVKNRIYKYFDYKSNGSVDLNKDIILTKENFSKYITCIINGIIR